MHRIIAITFALALAGCGASEPELLNLRKATEGPDEFAIIPTKPLQAPASYATLPVPTPGASNITDPTPEADLAAALGGNDAVRTSGGGIAAYAGRNGVNPAIRSELAAADLAFRKRHNGLLLERMFDVNVYFRAYAPQSLDQYSELERLRARGVRTPSAPPPASATE